MDRLEKIRMIVDEQIAKMAKETDRKFAYIHLYGTSQFAMMLAIKRNIQPELCAVAAMLHDIALYTLNCGKGAHAEKSAEYAESLLENMEAFSEEERQLITHAIRVHSQKLSKQDGVYAETLKDADVLSHYFYNPNIPMGERDRVRLYYLLEMIKATPTQ